MKIVGNTVGTSLPKPDLRQKDPRKGDFVKGKDEISEIVNDALAQAKASGEFKGDPGEPGQPGADGKDYILTDADKTEIAEQAAQMVDVPDVDLTGYAKTEDIPTDEHINGLIDTKLEGLPSGGGAQSDWNQNDPNAPDYVKNRPFWTDREVVLAEQQLTNPLDENNGISVYMLSGDFVPELYTPYVVRIDDTEYSADNTDCFFEDGQMYSISNTYIGNYGLSDGKTTEPNSDFPFCVFCNDGQIIFLITDNKPHVVSIFRDAHHKVAPIYLPNVTYVINMI